VLFGTVNWILRETVMDAMRIPEIDGQKLEDELKADFQRCIAEVTEAVNKARAGALIDDSEEAVRRAMSRLRQTVFQKAIQMKTQAAEAAFSPSAQPRRGEVASQGPPGGLL
jgi:hypothetical protein